MKKLLNREELIDLINEIFRFEGTSENTEALLKKLDNSVLDPDASEYIFDDNLTVEEVVDRALSYKPPKK